MHAKHACGLISLWRIRPSTTEFVGQWCGVVTELLYGGLLVENRSKTIFKMCVSVLAISTAYWVAVVLSSFEVISGCFMGACIATGLGLMVEVMPTKSFLDAITCRMLAKTCTVELAPTGTVDEFGMDEVGIDVVEGTIGWIVEHFLDCPAR